MPKKNLQITSTLPVVASIRFDGNVISTAYVRVNVRREIGLANAAYFVL